MSRMKDSLSNLQQCVNSKILLLQRISEKGFTVGNYLKEKNIALLENMDDNQKSTKKRKNKKEPLEPKEKTYDITFRLFNQGLSPKEIAIERCLALSTIYSHLQRFVESNTIPITDIIEPKRIQAINRIINMVGKDAGTTAIKSLCPPDVTYEEIRLVMTSSK